MKTIQTVRRSHNRSADFSPLRRSEANRVLKRTKVRAPVDAFTLIVGRYLAAGWAGWGWWTAFHPDGSTLVMVKPSELSVWRAPTFAEIDAAEKAKAITK